MTLRINRMLCVVRYIRYVWIINPWRMRFRHGSQCWSQPPPLLSPWSTGELSTIVGWQWLLFNSKDTCLAAMLCAFLWYPLTLWLARLVASYALQCLDPSEQLAAIILDMQYCSVYMYFSLAPMFCIVVLQDILKKLANHQHSPQESEAILVAREVDLMSAPQCGQHTRIVVAVSCWTLNNAAVQV